MGELALGDFESKVGRSFVFDLMNRSEMHLKSTGSIISRIIKKNPEKDEFIDTLCKSMYAN